MEEDWGGSLAEYEGCLLSGGSSPQAMEPGRALPSSNASGGSECSGGNSSSLAAAAAAAGWSMDDVQMLARSMEEDAAAAGWSMEDVAAMLECSPIKEDAAAAQPPQPQPRQRPEADAIAPCAQSASAQPLVLELHVQVVSGGAYTLRCSGDNTMLSVQKRLEALTGIRPEGQRLTLAGDTNSSSAAEALG
jgi:hypothetical protein